MSKVWEMDGLPGHLKLLLLRLADHANDDGRCHPGQASLARAVSGAERTVRHHLETLRRLGLVDVAARRRQASQEYQLRIPEASHAISWPSLIEAINSDDELVIDLTDQDRQPIAGLNPATGSEPSESSIGPETGQDRQPIAAQGQSAKVVVVPGQDRQPIAGLNANQDRQPDVVKTGNPLPVSKGNHQEPPLVLPTVERETAPQPRPADPIWDALIEAGYPQPTNGSERGKWNRAAKLLRESKATPTEVLRRSKIYRRTWVEPKRLEYTPLGLASNWARFNLDRTSPVTPIGGPPCGQCGGRGLIAHTPTGTAVPVDHGDAGEETYPCPSCKPAASKAGVA